MAYGEISMPRPVPQFLAKPVAAILLVAACLPCAQLARAQVYGAVRADGSILLTDTPGGAGLRLLAGATPPAEKRPKSPPAAAGDAVPDASPFSAIITEASRSSRVPRELIQAVIAVESAYNPSAVSNKGALGLMQLMPDTARRFAGGNMLDPRDNVLTGARYLRHLLDLFKDDLELALAAYNAGENAVIQAGYRIPAFAETQAYVPSVMARYRRLLASS